MNCGVGEGARLMWLLRDRCFAAVGIVAAPGRFRCEKFEYCGGPGAREGDGGREFGDAGREEEVEFRPPGSPPSGEAGRLCGPR